MNDITKITNVEFERTEEVISRKWLSVGAKKSRLLTLSDWTQLPDASIPQNIKNVWRAWRQKVRAVKRSSYNDADKALEALNSLQQQSPERLTIEEIQIIPTDPIPPSVELEEVKSSILKIVHESIDCNVIPRIINVEDIASMIDQKIQYATQILLDNFNSAIEKKLLDYINQDDHIPKDTVTFTKLMLDQVNKKHDRWIPKFNEDLLDEAMDFLGISEGMTSWPLLKIHANYEDLSLSEMAQKVVKDKNQWLKLTCKIETSRLEFIKRARTVNDYDSAMKLTQELAKIHFSDGY
jgi:hypothetical protein